MNRLSLHRTLHRITAQVAVVLVLLLTGLALNGVAHAHDDHGWHAHSGVPVPEAALEETSEAPNDGHRGHDVEQRALDLIVRAPVGRALPDQGVAPPPVSVVSVASVGRPPALSCWTFDSVADPPPPLLRATSGTARVLRASHRLRF